MRPRHECLGCRAWEGKTAHRDGCFNEAEARMPRMRPSSAAWRPFVRRFNEAEARMPRMRLRHTHRVGKILASMRPRHECLGCFVEGGYARGLGYASMRPRHECLGCRIGLVQREVSRSASMRPRHECLGCRCCTATTSAQAARFNEAEARMPRMRVAGYESNGKMIPLQ